MLEGSQFEGRLPTGVTTRRLLLWAFACALAPLIAGTLIFLTWLWLRWDGLMVAGLGTIFAGLFLFCIGVSCLVTHIFMRRAVAGPRSFHWPSALAGTLLLLNFPMAAVYAITAIDITMRYHVSVENQRDEPVETFLVSGGGVHVEFGPIGPHAVESRALNFREDGHLSFETRLDDVQRRGTIESYVTHGQSGRVHVLIGSDGTIDVFEDDD